jgi:hypothetical protein
LIERSDASAMSIVVRRGQAIAEPRPRLLRFDRPLAGGGSATPVRPGSEGQDLRHELARLALDLVVRTAEPVDFPARWTTYPFGQEVDRTRGQLAPIRSRAALLASFAREASIGATRGIVETGLPAGPVRVAYAIRWLELGDGRERPAWASFVAGPVEIVAGAIAERRTATDSVAPDAPIKPADQRNGEITT